MAWVRPRVVRTSVGRATRLGQAYDRLPVKVAAAVGGTPDPKRAAVKLPPAGAIPGADAN